MQTRPLQLALAEVLGAMCVWTVIMVLLTPSKAWALLDAGLLAVLSAWLVLKPSRIAVSVGILMLLGELGYSLSQGIQPWIGGYVVLFVAAYSAHAKAESKSKNTSNEVCRTCYRCGCSTHQEQVAG